MSDTPTVGRIDAAAYTIPTDQPESDGTLSWDSTTITVVEAQAGGCTGIGYSYGHRAVADIVQSTLAGVVYGSGGFTSYSDDELPPSSVAGSRLASRV